MTGEIKQLEAALREFPCEFNKLLELQDIAKTLLPEDTAQDVINEIDIAILEYDYGWTDLGEYYLSRAANLILKYSGECAGSDAGCFSPARLIASG